MMSRYVECFVKVVEERILMSPFFYMGISVGLTDADGAEIQFVSFAEVVACCPCIR